MRTTADDRRVSVLEVRARDAIGKIIARAEARVKGGLPAVKETCERPYLYPESVAEAALAVALFKVVVTQHYAPRKLREHHLKASEVLTYRWFNLDPQPSQLFLAWLCGSIYGRWCAGP